jgi:hypothetical protein
MLKNARNPCAFAGKYLGCSCCNTKQVRRAGKKAAKRREARIWRRHERAAENGS